MSEEVWLTATGGLNLIIWYTKAWGSKERAKEINFQIRFLLEAFGGQSLGEL